MKFRRHASLFAVCAPRPKVWGPMIESAADFPVEQSIGYLIRAAQRAYIQDLQARLAPYDISTGMWFFLRALFHEDGISQRELSARVGLMDPTTVEQLK